MVVVALSRRYILLPVVKADICKYEEIRGLYYSDEGFKEILQACSPKQFKEYFHIEHGFLFKGKRLYTPRTSIRSSPIQKYHQMDFQPIQAIRPLLLWRVSITGHNSDNKLHLFKGRQSVNLPKGQHKIQVCTHLCQYLRTSRRI